MRPIHAIRRHLGFAGSLLAMNMKASLVQRGAFTMQVLFMALNNFAFFVFWWALMQRVDTIRGWTLGDIQLLFGIVAAGFGLGVTVAGGVPHLGRFIVEGELDTLLTQPRPVLAYALGLRMHVSGAGDVLSGIVFIIWSGRVSWHTIPAAIVAVTASALIFVASGVVFFSLAFWLGSVETFSRQLWDLLVTFAMYPESLFGGLLRVVLFTVLPAGFVGYLPARLVEDPGVWRMMTLAGAAAVYLSTAVLVFDRGLRRYSSGSRFGTFG